MLLSAFCDAWIRNVLVGFLCVFVTAVCFVRVEVLREIVTVILFIPMIS